MGAIGNGLELLQLAGGAGAAELALVNESLATALAKLRFFRIAFGPADAQARQSPRRRRSSPTRCSPAASPSPGRRRRRHAAAARPAGLSRRALPREEPADGRHGADRASRRTRVVARGRRPPHRAAAASSGRMSPTARRSPASRPTACSSRCCARRSTTTGHAASRRPSPRRTERSALPASPREPTA